MVACFTKSENCRLNNNLHALLLGATDVISILACNMYSNRVNWQGVGSATSFTRGTYDGGEYMMESVRKWLRNNEEVQVLLASVMVVVGLWWLVRAVLTLLINLICPLLVVILAIVCVPQLRAPLLGQNYPLLANLLRNILLKLAENLRGQGQSCC